MQKRKLAYTLFLGGLLFVGVVHFVLATFAFDTGLSEIGLLLAGLALFGILLVNFGMAPPPEETEPDSDSD